MIHESHHRVEPESCNLHFFSQLLGEGHFRTICFNIEIVHLHRNGISLAVSLLASNLFREELDQFFVGFNDKVGKLHRLPMKSVRIDNQFLPVVCTPQAPHNGPEQVGLQCVRLTLVNKGFDNIVLEG